MALKKHNINTEWDKIKDYNIFPTFEDFEKKYNKNPNGSCFRKYAVYPWSKDNFFFGTYEEFQNYLHTTTEIPFYLKDKIGTKIKYLTIEEFYRDDNNTLMAKCECDCGKIVSYEWKKLKDDYYTTCGCIKGTGKNKTEIIKDNLLKSMPILIQKNWLYDKNIKRPEDISVSSEEEYWWKDNLGNEFLASPTAMIKKTSGTSFPEQAIVYFLSQSIPNVSNRWKFHTKNKTIEADIFLHDFNIAIEYDGVIWHKGKEERDKEKYKYLQQNNIKLIRIREPGLSCENDLADYIIERNGFDYDSLASVLNKLISIINKEYLLKLKNDYNSTDINNNEANILSTYYYGYEENNILLTELGELWDYEKNKIKPQFISMNSNKMVYLKCFRGVEFCINLAYLRDRCKTQKTSINNKSKHCILYLTNYCHESVILPKLISFTVNTINVRDKDILIDFSLENKTDRRISDFEYTECVIIKDNKYVFCNNRFSVNLQKETIKIMKNTINMGKCMGEAKWGRPFKIPPLSIENSKLVLEHRSKNLSNFKLLLIGNSWEQQNYACNIVSLLEIKDKKISKQKNKTLFWTDNQILFRDEKSVSKRKFSKQDIDKILELLNE